MKTTLFIITTLLFLSFFTPSVRAVANTADTYTSTGTITTQVDSAYPSSAAPLIKLHTHRTPVQWLVKQFRQDISPTVSVSGPAGKIILEKKIVTDDSSMTGLASSRSATTVAWARAWASSAAATSNQNALPAARQAD